MLTSKQRAYLRSLANTENSIIQVGKGGMNENLVKTIDDALEKREIVKIHVLENSLTDARSVCEKVCSILNAEPVQVIGSKFIIYRESKENKTIILPKSRNVR